MNSAAFIQVVYRTIPTSNHNNAQVMRLNSVLYIVLFLHQTTTGFWLRFCCCLLYIVLFLHQTTTLDHDMLDSLCCISYYSYIKPQPKNSMKNLT